MSPQQPGGADFIKELGNLTGLLLKMMEKGGGHEITGIYGYTIRIGHVGIPRMEYFGNLRQTAEGPVIDKVRQPIVEVFNEPSLLRVVVELPGIDECDIHTQIRGQIVSLTAGDGERRYAKEIFLPCPVAQDPVVQHYHNGLLDLYLPKK